MQRLPLKIILLIFAGMASLHASAINFSLDSIAEWGKFPRFCVNTYRWGDRFFNSYDSVYVVGTGTKFNVKITTDSWADNYHFMLPNSQQVDMRSDASTSAGAYLTYLAVSMGYDINISSLFSGVKDARSRYRFGFDCALLSVEVYTEKNEVGTRIRRFGPLRHVNMPFDGISIRSWGFDLYYFFNNKRYSQAAAYNFSKIQRRSQGSFYAGIAIYGQRYDFDFSQLEPRLTDMLPADWEGHHWRTSTRNYGFRFGYGYNWVFARNWVLCGSMSPIIGVKKGYINSDEKRTSFALYQRGKASIVWNHGRWFVGGVANISLAIVSNRRTTFLGTNFSASTAVGYRFNLW